MKSAYQLVGWKTRTDSRGVSDITSIGQMYSSA